MCVAVQEFQRHFPGLAPSVVDALYDTFNQMLALVRYNCQVCAPPRPAASLLPTVPCCAL